MGRNRRGSAVGVPTPPTAPSRSPSGSVRSSRKHLSAASSVTLVSSEVRAFDVEADMAFALVVSDPNARPRHFRSLFEECIFIFTAMMAVASTTFLQGVIVINTGTIGRDLQMTAAQITWLAAALGLASGSSMIFFSRTADLFGRKLQLLSGLLLLSLFSLLAAFAPDAVSLNILSGFLGLGTSIVAPPAIGTLFATYPPGRRLNRVTGAMGAANPLGFLLGSISSGLATRYASWRESFLVVAIFFFMLAGLAVGTMPSLPRAGTARRLLRDFDPLGTVLIVTGTAGLSAALTEGPELGWGSYQVLLLLFVGVGALLLLAVWEPHAASPLIPPRIFADATFSLTLVCAALGYMSFVTNLFWVSLFMQDVQLLSPLTIAVRLLPQALVGPLWSYLGEELVRFVSGRLVMGVGGLGYLGGAVLTLLMRSDSSYWLILLPALCITVLGADFQFIVSNLYIASHLSPTHASLAAGLLQTALKLSISLGLATTSALHGAARKTPDGDAPPVAPYHRVFVCTAVFAALSLALVPFLKIGRQGVLVAGDDGGEKGLAERETGRGSARGGSGAGEEEGGGGGGGGGAGAHRQRRVVSSFTTRDGRYVDVECFRACQRCGVEELLFFPNAGCPLVDV